jgi:hypothetical protein
MIAGWFGQVGSEIQTVASGDSQRVISITCRTAPVPPTVAQACTRLAGTRAEDQVAHRVENAGSPEMPT